MRPAKHRGRKSRKLNSLRWRVSRARQGGHSRAARYSKVWQALMMYYLKEKRCGFTATSSFAAWLTEHGLDRVAAEAVVESTPKSA